MHLMSCLPRVMVAYLYIILCNTRSPASEPYSLCTGCLPGPMVESAAETTKVEYSR